MLAVFDRLVHKIKDLFYLLEGLPLIRIRNKLQKSRFVIVGAIATTIDFSLLLTITALGVHSIIANFISTTTSFCFSFLANRHYTFKATEAHVGRQMTIFVIVTLFGIWVLQPPVILLGQKVIGEHFNFPSLLTLALSKLVATGVTLVWNYYTYSRVVFKKKA